jgi:hypothetical protein
MLASHTLSFSSRTVPTTFGAGKLLLAQFSSVTEGDESFSCTTFEQVYQGLSFINICKSKNLRGLSMQLKKEPTKFTLRDAMQLAPQVHASMLQVRVGAQWP